MASDMIDNRLFSGNSAIRLSVAGQEGERSTIPHPLVEECFSITLADLKRLFGREELLRAVKDAQPVHFQIAGNVFSIYLLAEPHRLPRRQRGASDRECRRLSVGGISCVFRSILRFDALILLPICRILCCLQLPGMGDRNATRANIPQG
jgi:hypothetical protein